jgi:hypothetical protein
MPLIGRARSGVVRPDQGQKVTGLGGSQAKTNKQYSGQIQAILPAAPPLAGLRFRCHRLLLPFGPANRIGPLVRLSALVELYPDNL